MLPDIDAEHRRGAVHQRVLAVRRLHDLQLAVLDRQPRPAGAELPLAGFHEVGAELVVAGEIGVDRGLQLARQAPAAAVRLHPLPEVQVVVVLAGIVEERLVLAEGLLDDRLDRLVGHAGFGRQLVHHVDIGLVVLVVVELQRLLRHEGLEGLVAVGQRRKRERHGCLLLGIIGS